MTQPDTITLSRADAETIKRVLTDTTMHYDGFDYLQMRRRVEGAGHFCAVLNARSALVLLEKELK